MRHAHIALGPLLASLALMPNVVGQPQAVGPSLVGEIAIRMVATSPRNPDRMVFLYPQDIPTLPGSTLLGRSLDGGATTEVIAVAGSEFGMDRVRDLEFSKTGVLYVATDTTIYKSEDVGSTYMALWSAPNLGDTIYGVAIDPFDDESIWACGDFVNGAGGSVVRSPDLGATWIDLPPAGITGNATTNRILFDADRESRVMVHQGETFYRSEDGGQSFPFTGGQRPAPSFIEFVPVDANDVALLYRGTLFLQGPFSIETSTDDWASTTMIDRFQFPRTGVVQNPLFPDRLAFATDSGHAHSTDGGLTWTGVTVGELSTRASHIAFAPDFTNPSDPLADSLLTGSNEGLRSHLVDGISNARSIPIPSTRDLMERPGSGGLRIDPESKDRWIYSELIGSIFTSLISENRGKTWVHVPKLREWGTSAGAEFAAGGEYLVSPRGPILAPTVIGHLLVREDGSYEARGVFPGSAGSSVVSGAVRVIPSPLDSTQLIGTSDPDGFPFGRLFSSLNGGATWSMIDALGINGGSFTTFFGYRFIGLRPSPSGIDVVRTELQIQFSTDEQFIEWSPDLGATWVTVPVTGAYAAITVNSTFPEIVYATSGNPAESMIRSDDRGFTWTPVGPPGSHGDIARGHLDPNLVVRQTITNGEFIFGGATATALEVSRDGGQTWDPLSDPGGPVGPPTIAPDDSYVVSDGRIIELAIDLGIPECAATLNSTGSAATIRAVGSNSLANDDVTLVATHLPTSTFGIFIVSMTAGFTSNLAGGDGNLCLSGEIARFQQSALQASATGVMPFRIDTSGVPQGAALVPIIAGDTWRFQAWFRDGMTSNLTDALAITFVQ